MSSNAARRALLASIAAFVPTLAAAQSAPVPPISDPAVVRPPVAAPLGGKRVFLPVEFARFVPKTAYDMLVQVPGFSIRTADQERGLGQASENVLINGQRIANKSGGAVDELQRVSATNVERIELVEAASLGIAGLSGQVANVVVKAAKKGSGQFEWKPDFRAHYSKPNLYRGSVSYTGRKGPMDYTFSVKDDGGRGAFGGPIRIFDPLGVNIETRYETYHGESDLLTFQGKFGIDGPGSSVANLTVGYTPYWNPYVSRDRRVRTDGVDSSRVTQATLNGYYIDVSGDLAFAFGPGRLKLIGLRHFDHEPIVTTQIQRFVSGADPNGVRFGRNSRIGETVLRGEYQFKTGRDDWQFSLERAFNSLDQRGSLEALQPDDRLEPVPFPGGTGKVVETRYEALATFSHALTPKLDLQVVGGAETSKLQRVDGDVPPRKFFRPKGSITLGWHPAKTWEASLKLRRRVGQISFYDFLAQPNLQQDRENSGNPDLVPPQSWEAEAEAAHDLGRWGKSRLTAYIHRIEDIIDVIPIGMDGEGIGNLPKARQIGLKSVTTLLGDPIGWTGAKLDATLALESSSVRDPLTGQKRAISGNDHISWDLELRHDVPHSQIAWGGELSYQKRAGYTYLTEVYRSWEGPVFADLFIEHKNLLGLTARFTLGNIFNARHRRDRIVYAGRRTFAPIAFVQENNQLIGPVFSFSLRGKF